MQSQDCAMHYSTSRGKIETKYLYRRYYRYCRYCISIDIIDWPSTWRQRPPALWRTQHVELKHYKCFPKRT